MYVFIQSAHYAIHFVTYTLYLYFTSYYLHCYFATVCFLFRMLVLVYTVLSVFFLNPVIKPYYLIL